jgi:hypothetical protein
LRARFLVPPVSSQHTHDAIHATHDIGGDVGAGTTADEHGEGRFQVPSELSHDLSSSSEATQCHDLNLRAAVHLNTIL